MLRATVIAHHGAFYWQTGDGMRRDPETGDKVILTEWFGPYATEQDAHDAFRLFVEQTYGARAAS